MESGKLNHRVRVQKNIGTQNALGQPAQSWVTIKTVYASIDTLSGRELEAARQVDSTTTHRIGMRWHPGMATNLRLVFQGRYFDINQIANVNEKNVELILYVQEIKL